MQQSFDKYLMFKNRLEKVYRHISRQARKQGVSCYRIYDHDLPEFPFILEVYDNRLYVSEYRRRHGLSEEAHNSWLDACVEVMMDVIVIPQDAVFIKMRQRKAGRQGQYQKLDEEKNEYQVEEGGFRFIVNLSDYLDTGLFLDHRITRKMVQDEASGKNMLNLFCYTGSFSVYAAGGGAASVTSVDLSKTYISWTERNMKLNFPDYKAHFPVQADAREFLKGESPGKYDLVILDPPTFSNSKRMEGILDIQRDHVELINDCLNLMPAGGILYFSTNYTKFILDEKKLNASEIKDITRRTTPFDFEGKLKRPCFRLVK